MGSTLLLGLNSNLEKRDKHHDMTQMHCRGLSSTSAAATCDNLTADPILPTFAEVAWDMQQPYHAKQSLT